MVTQSTVGNADLAHIIGKTRDAEAHGPEGMSTGEKLTVALVLNRPDWLTAMNYSIAEAIERIGPEWCRLIPAAAKQFKQESDAAAYAAAVKEHDSKLDNFVKLRETSDKELEFSARVVTSGSAPGYRDVYPTFDLVPKPHGELRRPAVRTTLSLSPQDGETVVEAITDVHRFSWRNGHTPIDATPEETRPDWLGEE